MAIDVEAVRHQAREFEEALRRNPDDAQAHYSLGVLTLGGFIAGIIFWGGFNTALEATNTEAFCISCHEMESNVYVEIKDTIHYTNRSGVRATCPDCHVPREWGYKMIRKIRASNELLHKALGKKSVRRPMPNVDARRFAASITRHTPRRQHRRPDVLGMPNAAATALAATAGNRGLGVSITATAASAATPPDTNRAERRDIRTDMVTSERRRPTLEVRARFASLRPCASDAGAPARRRRSARG